MPQSKPAYTEEFKREVLAYQASTAAHFGVSANRPEGMAPKGATETAEQELGRLRRENRELQMRCEI